MILADGGIDAASAGLSYVRDATPEVGDSEHRVRQCPSDTSHCGSWCGAHSFEDPQRERFWGCSRSSSSLQMGSDARLGRKTGPACKRYASEILPIHLRLRLVPSSILAHSNLWPIPQHFSHSRPIDPLISYWWSLGARMCPVFTLWWTNIAMENHHF